ncbi:alpha-N-acetylgalactosaminidase-like [Amphiura filiformis]|uniref:alpha-N-acetylgalactosaminidase-like n=1 Tax=Amphiura filiformis TaxID=82378 RepID=UPI003B224E91
MMNLLLQLLTLTSLCLTVYGLDNGLALTPPMGWLSWERFRCITDCKNDPDNCVSENLYKVMADQIVKDGYLAAGYDHVNIDDCWMAAERDSQGKLVADPERFPNGMKALADYVHSKGLKLGIYESMGYKTCRGLPGTYGHIETDAKTFAEWGIDMVKMDKCHTPGAALTQQGFINMSIAMNKTGRPMIFSCEWPNVGGNRNWTLIANHCNTIRNGRDIQDSWPSLITILDSFITNQDTFAAISKPGSYNDPDMLIIGDYSLSLDQSKSQMALWSIMAVQMMMSNDLRTIPIQFKEILLNKEVIKVNQDKLGIMGKRIMKTPDHQIEIWTKPLSGDSFAVVFFSRAEDIPRPVTVTPERLGFNHTAGYIMYELFDHQHLGHFMANEDLSFKVNPVGVVMLRGDPAHGKTKLDYIKSNKIL